MNTNTATTDIFATATAKAVQMRIDGFGWKDILAATGLNHTQAEIAYLKATLPAEAFEDFSPEAVCRLRSEGVAWGVIGVRLSVPEARVRAAFKAQTNTLSEGQRIGKGGRFLMQDGVLYADVLKASGTVIPTDAGRAGARIAAASQRMLKLDMSELKAYAADLGIEVKKGTTKASLIKKIQAALKG